MLGTLVHQFSISQHQSWLINKCQWEAPQSLAVPAFSAVLATIVEIQDTRPQIARPRTLPLAMAVASRVISRVTVLMAVQIPPVVQVSVWEAETRPAIAVAQQAISHVTVQSMAVWMALSATSVAARVTSRVIARTPVLLAVSKEDQVGSKAAHHKLAVTAVLEDSVTDRCNATHAVGMVICLETALKALNVTIAASLDTFRRIAPLRCPRSVFVTAASSLVISKPTALPK
ncbi:hypothetical protein FKW77_001016 [Venturia effusa]|uniref:Uncharacterized protein n=1 Tax=Venturia effusa TaxID=50376 RepID=A0A517LM44_9PEZI|nr:hypothetical protein FKW77_001016 [Venturia effusa]